jgi:2-octaprenylphenol hydroxylase
MMTRVTIVGGGISGLTAALDLANRGLHVTVLDRSSIKNTNPPVSNFDSRIYTIRPGLIDYLSYLGVWGQIDSRRLQPVYRMCVRGDNERSLLEFDSLKCEVDSLATTVEEIYLARALMRACTACGNIDYRSNCEFESVGYEIDRILVRTSQGELSSKLLVAADGVQSRVRKGIGIEFEVKDYQSLAIVANFQAEMSHGGCAYQIFFDDGILALLPLPGNRVSMVWSLPESLAKNILSVGGEGLSDQVFRRFDTLGALRCITPLRSFPLMRGVAREYTTERVALIGDALRHIHPLAGQGLNLGLADARKLGELIGAATTDDPGSQQILRRYARSRREETIVFSEFTDLLSGLFSRNKLWSKVGNAGFTLVNQCPPLKRYFVNRAVE